ncbi:DUF2635 domain-containing protein [Undibacterium sp. RuRC25W]|uniref:DUF2635 domain-containing protein n=1 Tax=Undibacterium sp. RuRC25W TaxID=3413047 RepID=UPI003BF384E0
MYAIPIAGRTVPIPGTRKLLPATGQNIGQVTQYWQRRFRDGDITLSEAAPAPTAAAAPVAPVAATAATPIPAANAASTPAPAPATAASNTPEPARSAS